MALQDPSNPWAPGAWDDYINAFQAPVDIVPAPDATVDPLAVASTMGPKGRNTAPQQLAQVAPAADEAAVPTAYAPPASPLLVPPLLGQDAEPAAPGIEADAISGGKPAGVSDLVNVAGTDTQTAPPATLDERLKPSDAALPSVREREDEQSAEQLGLDLANMSPEQQELARAKIEGAKQNFAASRILEESERTRKAAEDNARIVETAVKGGIQRAADLDAEAKQLAAQDPMDNIPGYRKVLGVLGAIVGGFAASSTGRNMGLEVVEKIADQAAAQQAQKLRVNAQQRAGIGEDIGRAKDLYQASEAVRLATYDSAIKTLEQEVQTFDPRGTTALRVMDNINQLRAKRAELLAKYQQEQQKRIEGALKEERERAQLLETQRHNMAQEKTAQTSAYADLLRAKTEGKKADAEIEVLPPEYFEMQGLPKPATPMSKKDYGTWLENRGKAQTQENQSRAVTNAMPGLAIKDKDGNEAPFVATGTPEAVEKLRTRESKIREIVGLIDDARRTRSGWSSDIGNSAEKQQLDAIWGKAKLVAKDAFELGQITSADVDLLKGGLGTDNPSKLRDPRPGMEKARELLVKGIRNDLEAHGYPKDQPYDIPDLQGRSATTTPEQFDLKVVLGTKYAEKPDDPEFGGGYTISDKQRTLIDQWEQDAASPDEATRARAVEWLSQAAKGAAISDVKSYAKAAFDRVVTSASTAAPSPELLGPEVH